MHQYYDPKFFHVMSAWMNSSSSRAPGLAARSEEQAARLRALLATSQVPLHIKNKFHFFSFQVDPNLRG